MGLLSDIKIDGNIIKETLNGVGGLFSTLREVLTGEVSPDKKLAALQQIDALEQQLKLGQIETNKIEAASTSIFIAGWRPYIGWICGTSLGVYYIPQALMATVLWTIQCVMAMSSAVDITVLVLPSYPLIFEVSEIMGLVASLLGMAGLRSWDKMKGA
jgi:hypothetical protein